MFTKHLPAFGIGLLSLFMIGTATPVAAADGVAVDVAYQYLRISSDGNSTSIPAGFALGVAAPLPGPLQAVVDFGWSRKSFTGASTTATSIGAGLRYALTVPGVSPYVQGVVGAEIDRASASNLSLDITSTDSHFMVQPGAGLMFGTGIWNGFVEADYRRVVVSGAGDNDFVFRAGFIWRFGK
jgi:hypothetical protein